LLLVLGCAPAVSSPTPPEHGADELSGLRRENQALRRRMQMLEDRILRLEQATLSPVARVQVPAPVAAASSEPFATAGEPKPATTRVRHSTKSISLGTAPPPPGAAFAEEGWDEAEDPYGTAEDEAPDVSAGQGGQYLLVGSRLVELTRERGTTAPDPPARSKQARSVEARYRAAMALYRAGDFVGAEQAFDALARDAPTSDLADNALYWKGESAYDQAHYADALAAFTEVVERYGGGNKAPDALLKIGLCYDKLGDLANAHDVLARLVAAYPGAPASAIARARLAELEVNT